MATMGANERQYALQRRQNERKDQRELTKFGKHAAEATTECASLGERSHTR